MKKFIIAVLCFLLLLFTNFTVLAASETEIYADPLVVNKGDTLIFPVNIKNNLGLMGFKLTFTYDTNCFEIISVDRGEITENGNFNDNFSKEDGKYDVVWNDSEEVIQDGSLLFLQVKVNEISSKKAINITYSQEDTFDEKWQDVILKCSPIEFVSSDESLTNIQTTALATASKSEKADDNSNYIKTAVEAAMKQAQIEKISELTDGEKDAFIESVNFYLSAFTGTVENGVDTIEKIQEKYDDALGERFVQSSLECVDPSVILDTIDKVLNEMNLESFNKIPDNKKLEFSEKVYEKLNTISNDVTSTPEDAEEAYNAVLSLYSQAKDMTNPIERWMVLIVAAIALIVVVTTVFIALHFKNKRCKTCNL